jgi:hypothetical protein
VHSRCQAAMREGEAASSVSPPVVYAWAMRDLLPYKLLSEQQPRNNVRTCQQCVEDSGRVLTGWPPIEASMPGGHAGTIRHQKTRPSITPRRSCRTTCECEPGRSSSGGPTPQRRGRRGGECFPGLHTLAGRLPRPRVRLLPIPVRRRTNPPGHAGRCAWTGNTPLHTTRCPVGSGLEGDRSTRATESSARCTPSSPRPNPPPLMGRAGGGLRNRRNICGVEY